MWTAGKKGLNCGKIAFYLFLVFFFRAELESRCCWRTAVPAPRGDCWFCGEAQGRGFDKKACRGGEWNFCLFPTLCFHLYPAGLLHFNAVLWDTSPSRGSAWLCTCSLEFWWEQCSGASGIKGYQVCSAPWVISCLRLKKSGQAACDSTQVPFLTLQPEGDNADLCHSRDGQEPSDAAGA